MGSIKFSRLFEVASKGLPAIATTYEYIGT